MISEKILAAMRLAGGISVKSQDDDGNLHVSVNFKVIEDRFPAYLDEVVKLTINDVDREFFDAGLIAYTVTPEGDLLWKPTLKWTDLAGDIMKPWKSTK